MSNTEAIRPATEQDYIAMDRLQTAAVRNWCASVYSSELIDSWVGTPKPERYLRNARQGSNYYVIPGGKDLAGFCGIHLERCLIDAVFVAPELGGQGVGSRMLGYLFMLADQSGIEQLLLESSLNAVGFYSRHGFVEYGRKQVALSDGQAIEGVLMCRLQP